jgi:hypothetical protein
MGRDKWIRREVARGRRDLAVGGGLGRPVGLGGFLLTPRDVGGRLWPRKRRGLTAMVGCGGWWTRGGSWEGRVASAAPPTPLLPPPHSWRRWCRGGCAWRRCRGWRRVRGSLGGLVASAAPPPSSSWHISCVAVQVARSVYGSSSARTLDGCDGDAVSRSGDGYVQQCLSGVWEVVAG